jgi:hypothetical protein
MRSEGHRSSYSLLIVRPLQADTFREEIRDTYSLIFSRTPKSKDIASQLFGEKGFLVQYTNMPGRIHQPDSKVGYRSIAPAPAGKHMINILQWESTHETPSTDHFEYFRPHLCSVVREMMDWKPITFSDLFIPGYRDRFTWYTAYFGVFVGIFALLSVFLSAAQLGVMVIAWKHPVAPPT